MDFLQLLNQTSSPEQRKQLEREEYAIKTLAELNYYKDLLERKYKILYAFRNRLEGDREGLLERSKATGELKAGELNGTHSTEGTMEDLKFELIIDQSNVAGITQIIEAFQFELSTPIKLSDSITQNSIFKVIDLSDPNASPECYIYSDTLSATMKIECDEVTIFSRNSRSEFGKNAVGKKKGDKIEYAVKGQTQRFQILDVL